LFQKSAIMKTYIKKETIDGLFTNKLRIYFLIKNNSKHHELCAKLMHGYSYLIRFPAKKKKGMDFPYSTDSLCELKKNLSWLTFARISIKTAYQKEDCNLKQNVRIRFPPNLLNELVSVLYQIILCHT
jgi:hypothetical protein